MKECKVVGMWLFGGNVVIKRGYVLLSGVNDELKRESS